MEKLAEIARQTGAPVNVNITNNFNNKADNIKVTAGNQGRTPVIEGALESKVTQLESEKAELQ